MGLYFIVVHNGFRIMSMGSVRTDNILHIEPGQSYFIYGPVNDTV